MIYLDVTSSCKSPLNTGVQRVVRGLFRALSTVTRVTPLVWDPALKSYCTLSDRERGFLANPFNGRLASGDAEPGRRANPIPVWSKFARRLAHRRHRLDFDTKLTVADALFVPEIFQDNRTSWLSNLSAHSPARRVAVCHDAIAWSRPDITPPARQDGFAAYLTALSRFDHVVAISRETAHALQTFWRERHQPQPPVSVHPWPADHAGVPRNLLPPGNRPAPTVLCVGTFEPRKNHLVLLEACRQLWTRGLRFELVLVGRTTAQWGARVLAQIDASQKAGHPVRWLRHVDDDTLRRAYEECAFTVFPSLMEGFGLPVLESLWHGRPCVCGNNGALGEVSAGGGCVPVDQTDPASVVAAMERLLTDPSFYAQQSDAAAQRPFDTWESLATALLPLLSADAR